MVLERNAALGLGLFDVVDAGEAAVGEHGVGQRPEVFSGLQLGRIWRQEEQVDVFQHAQFGTCMPLRAVQNQHDLLGGADGDRFGEGGEPDLQDLDADRGSQVENGAARGGMDEVDDVAPFEAMGHCGTRPLADRRPHPPQERIEPDAVLVGGPQLQGCLVHEQ